MMNTVRLNTGAEMPVIGLGTWKSEPGKVGAAVEYALTECGYRHIDCASIYHNEKEIGGALARIFSHGGIKREDLFITSKLWNTDHAKDDAIKACKKTLTDLQLDYLDLYLMHWSIAQKPYSPLEYTMGLVKADSVSVRETWESMEELVALGLVRSIGVANFTGAMLMDLLSYASRVPAMNQIELHPYNQQARLIEYCFSKNIAVTAYSPLGSPGTLDKKKNHPVLLSDPLIGSIADTHLVSCAAVLIRWALQRKTVVIPKSINKERIKENIAAFDFELSKDDMQKIGELERRHRFVDPWEWWKIPYFD